VNLQGFPDVNQYYIQKPFGTAVFKPYFCTPKTNWFCAGLTHGVMVTLLILVQSFMVRIHMGQQRRSRFIPASPFYFKKVVSSVEIEKITAIVKIYFIKEKMSRL
jgi:hypothetical protein